MFKLLGVCVLIYAAYAAVTGSIQVRSGIGSRTVNREESPIYFWTCVVIYAGLAVALMTVF
ncbi:MAG: hypothetical protein ACRETM_00470 [Stenotrophobium sp.]